MVATPSYDGKVTSEYMQSIFDYLVSTSLNISYSVLPKESLVTRARNILFNNYFYDIENKDLTHLLWQDSDVSASGYGLERILSYDLDVIGMAVPLKTFPSENGILSAVAGVKEEVGELLYKTKYLGCGIMMLSNKAIMDIVSYCENNNQWTWNFELDRKEYDVFRVGSNNKNFYESEDWYICSILSKIGYDIYVDSGSSVSHAGVYRPGMPINPQAIGMDYQQPLPIESRNRYWCPNDSKLPKEIFD